MAHKPSNITARLTRLLVKGRRLYVYCTKEVWSDPRNTLFVRGVKILNLSARSFMNSDLQMRACAMTYRLILALVPALALLFAIGRGFGFQNLLQSQLFSYFPAQRQSLEAAFGFVDSYLAQSSEGLFVGVGIGFLLYTLISLISDVENTFNAIWGVRSGRTIWRKITDYTAICLILPILMICSGGITVVVSTALHRILPFEFMTPLITFMLDFASLVLVWLFFTGAYMLIPNTHVKFKNAFPAGILAGTAFMILQWLFVTGQMYVTRYNAIYGSFAFLPLLMIWLQLVWVITLSGAVICYSAQNFVLFSFGDEVASISIDYRRRILLAVCAVTVNRFDNKLKPLTADSISKLYNLPVTLVHESADTLVNAGVLMRVSLGGKEDVSGLAPAYSTDHMTVAAVINAVDHYGSDDFINTFKREFTSVNEMYDRMDAAFDKVGDDTLVRDLAIPQPNGLSTAQKDIDKASN